MAVIAACGVYQLSAPKDRCLTQCQAPLALPRRDGWARDLGAGVRHGAYCLGCCWALMVILITVGVMNVAAMAGLAVVVLIVKTDLAAGPGGWPAWPRWPSRWPSSGCRGWPRACTARPR